MYKMYNVLISELKKLLSAFCAIPPCKKGKKIKNASINRTCIHPSDMCNHRKISCQY